MAVTMLRLEKCVFRHTLGARTFYTSPLRKSNKKDILVSDISGIQC